MFCVEGSKLSLDEDIQDQESRWKTRWWKMANFRYSGLEKREL